MKPRITLITLGVADLERSLRFYRNGLGLPTAGIVGTEFKHGAVVFSSCRRNSSWRFTHAAASRTTPGWTLAAQLQCQLVWPTTLQAKPKSMP
ncbi:hypothetical protein THIX_60353 [Thiomonas sp. X19]|nr:hypothetical protein THIX_60353 [Thiomonas sp. X19]